MTRNLPLLFALLVAAVAAGWRLVGLGEWPTPFHPTVQYDQSALAARSLWLAADPASRTPDRAAWLDAVEFTHVISPPVLPGLVAGVYLATGEETPWVSKLFTTAFWLAAGWFVRSAAARTTGSRWAATIAFAWFVLTPFGIKVSRSFQTEPVLALGFAAAVWFLARLERPGWKSTLAAGAVCGAAAFAKPGVLFAPLVGGFAGLLLSVPVPNRLAKLIAFTGLTVLPSAVYGALLLRGHVGNKVMPELLATWWYYESVEKSIASVVGYGALGLAAAGVAFAARGRAYLLPGLLAGYVAYLAVFTFHCATHDYYHVPLMVLAAVAMAGPLSRLEQWLRASESRRFAVGLLVLAAYLVVTKNPDLGPWRWTPAARAEHARRAEEQSRQVAAYHRLRDAVGPGASVVALSEGFGFALEYHAGVRQTFWPQAALVPVLIRGGQLPEGFNTEAYLRELVLCRGFDFFAVTDFAEFERQPELRAALAKRGRVMVSDPDLLVFDLRGMRATGPR